jgi:hypothetical protein
MGVGDSVSEGVWDRSSVGFSVGVFIDVGISVGVVVRIVTEADVDSGVGKLGACLELQAQIPKSNITKNALCLFIFFLNHLTAAQRWLRSRAFSTPNILCLQPIVIYRAALLLV